MKMNKKFKVLFLLSLFAVLVFLVNVFLVDFSLAEDYIEFKNPWGMTPADMDPRMLAGSILRIALGLLGSLFLVMVTVGGYIWIFSGGNKEKFKKGKDLLVWSVAGIAVVLASYGILDWVMTDVFERLDVPAGNEACTARADAGWEWKIDDGDACCVKKDVAEAEKEKCDEYCPSQGTEVESFSWCTYECECRARTEPEECEAQGSDYVWSTWSDCCAKEEEMEEKWDECLDFCLGYDPEFFHDCTYECKCSCDGLVNPECDDTAGCSWLVPAGYCMSPLGITCESAVVPGTCSGDCFWVQEDGYCAED